MRAVFTFFSPHISAIVFHFCLGWTYYYAVPLTIPCLRMTMTHALIPYMLHFHFLFLISDRSSCVLSNPPSRSGILFFQFRSVPPWEFWSSRSSLFSWVLHFSQIVYVLYCIITKALMTMECWLHFATCCAFGQATELFQRRTSWRR